MNCKVSRNSTYPVDNKDEEIGIRSIRVKHFILQHLVHIYDTKNCIE